MGCCQSSPKQGKPLEDGTSTYNSSGIAQSSDTSASAWTKDTADKLQDSVDRIFGSEGKSLLGWEFSFSIADPLLETCPLIGCSTGFTALCGYGLNDIVGRNCRFLVDPVPKDKQDEKMRRHTKDYCEAVRNGKDYRIPRGELESWMPADRPANELFALQMNARKDGTLFNNMFYMKVFHLSMEMGAKERPYIVALQSELPQGKADLAKLASNLEELDARMDRVKKELAAMFFLRANMSRQQITKGWNSENGDISASLPSASVKRFAEEAPPGTLEKASNDIIAPTQLHASFSAEEVKPWDDQKYQQVRKLADASRNRGMVHLMQETQDEKLVAVKQMPNSWMQSSHEEFLRVHPKQTELPWQDIGCTRFLNNAGYKYASHLYGVFRNATDTFVVSSFARGGDLFGVAEAGPSAGPGRETAFAPLVIQICYALKVLHDLGIVHRDISLENVLSTGVPATNGQPAVQIIDFGMASTGRRFKDCTRGKASYEAPEMHNAGEYDAFLSDTFAVGVVVYAMLLCDYPWMSTKPGRCKCFEYVKQFGLRKYCAKRCVRGSTAKVDSVTPEPLMQLLEGLLSIDPAKRLTLGEKQWTEKRKSIWDTTWVKQNSGTMDYAKNAGA